MEEKYKSKYRISSARLSHWDYNREAVYFITICTKDQEHFFGKIHPPSPVQTRCFASVPPQEKDDDNQSPMHLSQIGEIAKTEWLKTPKIRQDMNLQLSEFIVMPNHFHAIISIGKNEYNSIHTTQEYSNRFGSQRKNLASIIRGFKSTVTIQARKIDPCFSWHPRFHDHIIRDEKAFHRISNYIKNNPEKWLKEKHYR
jgi:putative transposase